MHAKRVERLLEVPPHLLGFHGVLASGQHQLDQGELFGKPALSVGDIPVGVGQSLELRLLIGHVVIASVGTMTGMRHVSYGDAASASARSR